MFSLRFPDNRVSHFCYEANRGSMPMADMMKKFPAYYHFITERVRLCDIGGADNLEIHQP